MQRLDPHGNAPVVLRSTGVPKGPSLLGAGFLREAAICPQT